MSERRDLLVEIGTEELPPGALSDLARGFAEGLRQGLADTALEFGEIEHFATPRRLAVRVRGVSGAEPDREVVRRGPPVGQAFDDAGRPTQAASGFAKSCGVAVEALEQLETDKGLWLAHRSVEPGREARALVPDLVEHALLALPVPKRMRWGMGDVEFVRPVHWVVLLLGEDVIEARILGIATGRSTRGHRFHAPQPIELADPAHYEDRLEAEGRVLAGLDTRRERIRADVEARAREARGEALMDERLLEEVTALVEWPVALTGRFDEAFLELPDEVLIATMRDHQRYFPVAGAHGRLLPSFITVANLESRDPEAVRTGNERVVRPRLADAAFFWRADLAHPLAHYVPALGDVVYQRRLGTLLDKTHRVEALAARVAQAMGAEPERARRAAHLARADLMTDMVGEFPELQGTMGRYYALEAGEDPEVAAAIEELYRPRHAGGSLPATPTGRAVAIADKLDTLVGIFGIGETPSGDKDPYALRRAALGVLRIIIEGGMDLDLGELLAAAGAGYGELIERQITVEAVLGFMLERLRSWYLDDGVPADVFEAVAHRRPSRPYDFHRRVCAVAQFRRLPAAASLAAANKRVGNILRKAGRTPPETIAEGLLEAPEERRLAEALQAARERVAPLMAEGAYTEALTALAELREDVDRFFDEVLVMCEDERTRDNRLAILAQMHALFVQIADIARLQ